MDTTKLKYFRKTKGYTLAELSKQVGCTSSYLSQLERGLKQPSLKILRKISASLEVQLFDLISEDTTAPVTYPNNTTQYTVIHHQNRKSFLMPEIGTNYEFLTPYFSDGSDQTKITGIYNSLSPNTWSCEESVSLSFDFCIYLVQGTATVILADQREELTAGDSLYIRASVPHNIYNSGADNLIIIGFSERPSISEI